MLSCPRIVEKVSCGVRRPLFLPVQSAPRLLSTLSAIRHGIRRSATDREVRSSWHVKPSLKEDATVPRKRGSHILFETARKQWPRVVIREEDEGRYDRYPKRSVEKGTAVNRQREDRTTFGVKRKEWPRATTRDEDGIQLSAKDREPLDSRRMKRSDEEGLAADRVGKVQKTFEAKRRQWPGTITRGEEDESRYNRQTEARSDQAPRSGRTRISDLKIEYTTPASDFIYGTSSVLAALKAGRRKCYKLYVTEASENRPVSLDTLEKFASLRGAKVVLVKPNQIGSLDKASKGRPHNVRRCYLSDND